MTQIPHAGVERPEGEPPPLTAKPDYKMALGRAKAKFSQDQCTDLAAALTYYSVQAMFPALIAGVSLLGLFGNGKETTKQVVNVIAGIAGKDANDLKSVSSFIDNLQTGGGAGLAFALGILLALWSASGYVGAFSRMSNRIYDVAEGRPVFKLRPWLYLVTIVEVILLVIAAMALVLSGPVAHEIGSAIGLGAQAVTIWNWAKLPFVILIVMFIIGWMFWATPNVKRPFKIFNPGAMLAFFIWALGSLAFAWYVSNMGNYGKTYGPMATPIILLLWLWITNLAMLFGAEFDAEVTRTRQLKSGYPAEELVLLPVRDSAGIAKKAENYDEQIDKAHQLRVESGVHEDEVASMLPVDPQRRSDERTMAATESSPEKRPVTPSTRTVEGQPEVAAASAGPAPVIGRGGSHRETSEGAQMANSLSPQQRALSQQQAAERAEIAESRGERRRNFLAIARERRKVREQRAREEARIQAEQKKAEKQRRKEQAEAEAARPLEEKWAEAESVRDRFAHPNTREYRAVSAEREARRAEYFKNS